MDFFWNFNGFFYAFSDFLDFLKDFGCLDIFEFFRIFLCIFWDFLGFFGFLDFWPFLTTFWFIFFYGFSGFFFGGGAFWILFFKLLRFLLKVTKVTTGYQKWPEIGQNSIIRFIFAWWAKKALGRSPLQELEVGLRSGPYLLVSFMEKHKVIIAKDHI